MVSEFCLEGEQSCFLRRQPVLLLHDARVKLVEPPESYKIDLYRHCFPLRGVIDPNELILAAMSFHLSFRGF